MASDNMNDRKYNENLHKLKHLRDYKIAKDDPDVRGWDVLGERNEVLGRVDELIVDTQNEKVRYLVVDLKDNIRDEIFNRNADYEPVETNDSKNFMHTLSESERDRKFLVPVGLASLHESRNDVIVNHLNKNRLRNIPAYDASTDRPTRDLEVAVRDYYANPEPVKQVSSTEGEKHHPDNVWAKDPSLGRGRTEHVPEEHNIQTGSVKRSDVGSDHIPLPNNAKHDPSQRPSSDTDKTGDPRFYEHDHFDDERFYGPRRKQ